MNGGMRYSLVEGTEVGRCEFLCWLFRHVFCLQIFTDFLKFMYRLFNGVLRILYNYNTVCNII